MDALLGAAAFSSARAELGWLAPAVAASEESALGIGNRLTIIDRRPVSAHVACRRQRLRCHDRRRLWSVRIVEPPFPRGAGNELGFLGDLKSLSVRVSIDWRDGRKTSLQWITGKMSWLSNLRCLGLAWPMLRAGVRRASTALGCAGVLAQDCAGRLARLRWLESRTAHCPPFPTART